MSPGAAALEARALAVRINARGVLQPSTLRVTPGRWLAVVGPNGAGKSTLLRALGGVLPAGAQRSGSVHLAGRPIEQWSARERARQLAWLAQDDPARADLRAIDVALLGRLPHRAWWAPARASDRQVALDALDAVGMAAQADRELAQLSGGERRRVLLARLLATQAPVLLMDEPLAHLDLGFHGAWMQLVRRLCAQGSTVVSVLHEASVALAADDVLVLAEGRVIHQGPADDVHTHHAIESAFGPGVRVRSLAVAGTRTDADTGPGRADAGAAGRGPWVVVAQGGLDDSSGSRSVATSQEGPG